MKTILELKQELGRLYDEGRAIIEKCDVEKRTITVDEETRYEAIMAEMDALKVDIARREKLEGFKGVESCKAEALAATGNSRMGAGLATVLPPHLTPRKRCIAGTCERAIMACWLNCAPITIPT